MPRTNYRRRLVGFATGTGVVALVAVMALSSFASAGFPGATWAPYTDRSSSGCATAQAYPAHWAAASGHGKFKGDTTATTCPAYRGGAKTESYGDVYGELTVTAPIHLPTGTGGVNVSWNIVVAGSTTGTASTSGGCPVVYYNGSYNYGYTWYNYSDADSDCGAIGEVSLYGFTYVYDVTTGTYSYASNYWNNAYNTSGIENYSYSDSYTYSNSSYWIYNGSYSYSANYSYGSAGTLSGTYNPTWFVNGTFTHTDKYNVITEIEPSMDAEVYGYASGHATAALNMASGPNHEDLLPFSIW
jgi:hypothetical protein